METFTRDIAQAYIQSPSCLGRDVFMAAPVDMDVPPSTILKVVCPLYGIHESGLHWYLTYTSDQVDHPEVLRETLDPCVLIQREGNKLSGLVVLQFDSSMANGTPTFMAEEQRASTRYTRKPFRILSQTPSTLNGSNIARAPDRQNHCHVAVR